MTPEEQKNAVLPILQRAQEVAQVEPKVAYYARMYALEQIVGFPDRSAEMNGILKALLGTCEKDKKSLQIDNDTDKLYCEEFAWKIFARAEKADRAGVHTQDTTKTYYAASIFFEILRQFGELPEDLQQKQKFAVWRAAEVRKAIRENRPPRPLDDEPSQLPLGAMQPPPAPAAVDGGMNGPPMPSTNGLSAPNSLDLPSVPTMTHHVAYPTEPLPPSGATEVESVWTPPPLPEMVPGSQYQVGHRVLYRVKVDAIPSLATIAQVVPGTAPRFKYNVALKTHITEASIEQLAPCLEPDERVFWMRDGSAVPVTVVDANIMSWPPQYTIAMADGSTTAVNGTELSASPHFAAHSTQILSQPAAQPPSQQPLPNLPAAGSVGSDLIDHLDHDGPAPLPSSTAFGGSQPPADGGYARLPSQPSSASSVASYPSFTPQPYAPPHQPSFTQPPPAAQPQPPAAVRPSAPQPPTNQYAAPQQPTGGYHAPQPYMQPPHQPPPYRQQGGFVPDMKRINDAQKAARSAVSSLNFQDTEAAINYLQRALQALTNA